MLCAIDISSMASLNATRKKTWNSYHDVHVPTQWWWVFFFSHSKLSRSQAATTISDNKIAILTNRVPHLDNQPIVFPHRIHFPKTSRKLPQVSIILLFLLSFDLIAISSVDSLVSHHRCEEVWNARSTRDAQSTSAHSEGGWGGALLWSRRELY